MGQVIDYSWSRPGGAAIKQAGYTGVLRYLSHDPTKNLSLGERDELRGVGLDIGLVWEDAAQAALGGRGAGQADAQVALADARALGYPESCPIYFAVDWDTTPEQQPAIDEYLRGAAEVIGASRVGVYGSFYVVKRCFANGTASYGWQTLAWSGGQVSDHAALYQNGQQAFGGDADVNDVRGDWGPWKGPSAEPQPGPETTDPSRHWWGPYVTGADQVVELDSHCHAPVWTSGGWWYRGDTRVQPAVLGEYAEWVLANRIGGVWYVMDETGGPQGASAQGRLAPDQAWWTEDASTDSSGCGGTNPPAVAAGHGHWYALTPPAPPPAPVPSPPPTPTPPPAPPAVATLQRAALNLANATNALATASAAVVAAQQAVQEALKEVSQ